MSEFCKRYYKVLTLPLLLLATTGCGSRVDKGLPEITLRSVKPHAQKVTTSPTARLGPETPVDQLAPVPGDLLSGEGEDGEAGADAADAAPSAVDGADPVAGWTPPEPPPHAEFKHAEAPPPPSGSDGSVAGVAGEVISAGRDGVNF